MTNAMPPALADLLADAAGVRLRLALPVPENFVVTELGGAPESRAPVRGMDRP